MEISSSKDAVDWDRLKPQIWRMFVERKSVAQMTAEMKDLGFPATTHKLEYKLKQWNLRRKLDKKSFEYVDHQTRKRKVAGKESIVVLSGLRLSKSQLSRGQQHHMFETTIERVTKRLRQAPRSPTMPPNVPLRICTPPPMVLEFAWPSTLPWLEFQFHLSKMLRISLSSSTVSQAALRRPLSEAKVPHSTVDLEIDQLSQGFAQLCLFMPESFEGEHWARSQVLGGQATASSAEAMIEVAKVALFRLSNNLTTFEEKRGSAYDAVTSLGWSKRQWTDFFARLQGPTRNALVDKLFEMAVNHDNATIVDAMVECGADPLAPIPDYYCSLGHVVPWELALRYNRPMTIEVLAGKHGHPEHALHWAISASNFYWANRLLDEKVEFKYDESLPPAHLDEYWALPKRVTPVLVAVLASGNRTRTYNLESEDTQNHLHLVGRLLDLGYPACTDAIIAAGTLKHYHMLRLLQDASGKTLLRLQARQVATSSALQDACDFGQWSTVMRLCHLGVDRNITRSSAVTGDRERINCNESMTRKPLLALALEALSRRRRWSPFLDATILTLIRRGDPIPGNALHLVAKSGRNDFILELVSRGASVHSVDFQGKTPLSTSLVWNFAFGRNFDCALELIRLGARPTPEECVAALYSPSEELHKLVLDSAQVTPDARGPDGETILESACLSGISQSVESLLDRFPSIYDSGALCATVYMLCLANQANDDKTYPFKTSLDENNDAVGLNSIASSYRRILSKLLHRRLSSAVDPILETTAVGIATLAGDSCLISILVHSDPRKIHHVSGKFPVKAPFESLSDGLMRRTSGSGFWRSPSRQLMARVPDAREMISSPFRYLSGSRWNEAFSALLSCGFTPGDALASFTYKETVFQPLIRDQIYEALVRNSWPEDLDRPFSNGDTPLQAASRAGNIHDVRLLLQAGANVNRPAPTTRRVFLSDFLGTALQHAVLRSNLDLIQVLLDAGANVNGHPARYRGRTCLQLSAQKGYIGLARRFLELGANPSAPAATYRGITALEAAAQGGFLDFTHLLLASGVDTTSEKGRHPYLRAAWRAKRKGHEAIYRMLRRHREWTSADEHNFEDLSSKWESQFNAWASESEDWDGEYTEDGSDCESIEETQARENGVELGEPCFKVEMDEPDPVGTLRLDTTSGVSIRGEDSVKKRANGLKKAAPEDLKDVSVVDQTTFELVEMGGSDIEMADFVHLKAFEALEDTWWVDAN